MPGFVFYEGPSRIDRQPIVGIATYGTENAKTGNLVQTWILRSDIHPINAINLGADSSICGSCPLRGRIADASERTKKSDKFNTTPTVNKGRGCYVAVQNAPLQVFTSYQRGSYPHLSDEASSILAGRGLRYGSYGDPVAIPIKYWDSLVRYCTGKAEPGYTHQWRDKRFADWSKRVMASTHSLAENELAHSMGWRTFRLIADVSDCSDVEIICPASAEGGFKATCEKCGACNGRRGMGEGDMRHSVVIVAHGGDAKLGGALKTIVS